MVGNVALSLTRPTENDASMLLAWNKLDYMYDVAKHCVISAAIYSDVENCHIAKVSRGDTVGAALG